MVVLQHPSQPRSAPNRSLVNTDEFIGSYQNIANSLVISLFMVMRQVLTQRPPQSANSHASYLPQTFRFHAAYPSLRKRIQIWRIWSDLDRFHPRGPKQFLEGRLVDLVIVTNQVLGSGYREESNPLHGQIPSNLLHPIRGRMLRNASDLHSPCLDVDQEQHIDRMLSQPVPDIGLQKVHTGYLVAMLSDEGLPIGLRSRQLPLARVEVVVLEYAPDRLGVDLQPEISDRPSDSVDSPARRISHDQDLLLNPGWYFRSADLVGQLVGRLQDEPVPSLKGSHTGDRGDTFQLAPAHTFTKHAEGTPPSGREHQTLSLGHQGPVVISLGAHQGVRLDKSPMLMTDDSQEEQPQDERHGITLKIMCPFNDQLKPADHAAPAASLSDFVMVWRDLAWFGRLHKAS